MLARGDPSVAVWDVSVLAYHHYDIGVALKQRAFPDLRAEPGCFTGGPVAAGRWLDAAIEAITALKTLPDRCHPAHESKELGVEIRQMLFGKRRGIYRAVFCVVGEEVQVLRVP